MAKKTPKRNPLCANCGQKKSAHRVTNRTRQFDFDELARDFIQKVATCPSMLNVATVAGWFRSAVQFHALHCDPPSSPREPQKDETPRDAMIQHIQRMGGVRVLLSETMQEVAAYRKKCACNGLNECAECQRLDDLQDRLITRYKKLLELEVPREPHAALIAAIQRLRNAAPTDSDRIRCEVWTDDIHLVLEALKGQQA